MAKEFKRYLVTSALPYANGPVHIGHLAGVYIPADIYVRYLRLKGEEVLFIGGSDEHGVPITIKAKKEGVTPQDIVDRYHGIIKKSFEDFGITFDIYSRTTSPTHKALASDIFKTIEGKGGFVEKTSEQYFDESAQQFLADRYITGKCPHCGGDIRVGTRAFNCSNYSNQQAPCNFAIWRNIGGHQLSLTEAKEICEKEITSNELEMYRDDGTIYRKRLGLSPDKLQIVKI